MEFAPLQGSQFSELAILIIALTNGTTIGFELLFLS